jgi:hypothetical protein
MTLEPIRAPIADRPDPVAASSRRGPAPSSRPPRRRPAVVAILLLAFTAGFTILPAAQAKPRTAAPPKKAAPVPVRTDSTRLPHRVIAYYFHTNQRCSNCRKIEAYSHEAIEKAFAKELKDGRLVWRLVNIQEKDNEHFVKDYELYTKSLVLVDEAKGRQVRWKNLTRVWEFLGDRGGFLKYVQDEVRGYLTDQS